MIEQQIMPALGVNDAGHLTLGGCDTVALAEQFGTPCYVMDEATIVANCRAFQTALTATYGDNYTVAYASKALSCKEIYRIMAREGMGIDVVSGSELYTALSAGFPADRVYFHGNNKTDEELAQGLDAGIRRFVIDNIPELLRLEALCQQRGQRIEAAVRIKPGIDAHTHEFVQTGQIDSKFGVALDNDEALQFFRRASALECVAVVGLHCHIGSQIFDPEPFAVAVEKLMGFCRQLNDELGTAITELNVGGGYGIRYIDSHDPRGLDEVAAATADAVKRYAAQLGLPLPHLVFEPGRSIVGNAGLTLYRVGSVKTIPDVRTYVAVDGGMADNPRFALYEAVYHAMLPQRPTAAASQTVTIAGRCCESGDLVARDIKLPPVEAGEPLAVLATGAYNYSMASHYNRLPKPPIVLVSGGVPRVIVRRESYQDVCVCDV